MKRVGIIGGGQLAWMMAEPAQRLGIELIIQTPSPTDPAVTIATKTVLGAIADASATQALASLCDVITFENEFVDLDALQLLANQGTIFRPKLDAIRPLLDKYHQRSYFRDHDLPTPAFETVDPTTKFDSFPVVLKTRRHGYDGQGTFILHDAAQLNQTLQKLANIPLLREEFVPFERELAMMAARSPSGEIVTYPVVETEQKNNVCRWVVAPAQVSVLVAEQCQAIACQILTDLDVVGIFGIELFLTADDRVFVNEIAPRTHNSGHYTIDACEVSQFEQQLRAVCDFPLGNPQMKFPGAVMVNLLGYETSTSDYLAQRDALSKLPNTFVHWYGKAESRPGRKLGHVTRVLDMNDRDDLIAEARRMESLWYPN